MGKLRERRRQEKKRRELIQCAIASGITIVLLAIIFVVISVIKSQGSGGVVANGKNSQSQIENNDIDNNTNGNKEETPESQGEESDSMQIVMVGDMLMHDKVVESGKQDDGSYNFDHLFTNIKEYLSAADLAIVNQETIMAGPAYGYTGYPSFNTPIELAGAEEKAGFDLLLFATNHALDKGVKGVQSCMNLMDETYPNLDYVGINRDEQAHEEIYTYESNGITVAVLNYTYGHNGVKLPNNRKYLINELNEEKIRSDIRKAEEIADFTVLCPHWGTELTFEVDERQKELAAIFLEEGVDLVLGAHPHVIQPIEWMTHENGNQMLVYYSLGNFVNGTDSTGHGVTNRMVGGVADVTITRNEATGKVEISGYGAKPIVCHIANGNEYSVYFLEDYTEELAEKNLAREQDEEFSLSLCESIVSQVWGE